ncbi:SDR family oxidoreductase, partial [Rhodoplanes elegans]|uniref:SDR family oxidoreductase n=1 Tax=Rhodoplanes elegans TaxID=29408 RepID=UPI000DAC68FE
AEALCAEIAAAGGVARPVVAHLADHDAVLRLVPAAVAAVGPLTLLVNNASTFERDEIGGLDRALFDLHMAVNLRAPVFLAEVFAAQAPAGTDPSVVNIVDQRVYKPTPRFLSYGLSKSALHTATTTLAQALAPHVRVNAVAPGPTLPSPRQDLEAFARQAAAVPLGRGPSPEEVADAVLYLVRARSVTGETIAVDGGQRLAWQTPDAVGAEE